MPEERGWQEGLLGKGGHSLGPPPPRPPTRRCRRPPSPWPCPGGLAGPRACPWSLWPCAPATPTILDSRHTESPRAVLSSSLVRWAVLPIQRRAGWTASRARGQCSLHVTAMDLLETPRGRPFTGARRCFGRPARCAASGSGWRSRFILC